MSNWRHLIQKVWDGALHMTEDDAARVGMSQAEMLHEAARCIETAVLARDPRFARGGTIPADTVVIVGEDCCSLYYSPDFEKAIRAIHKNKSLYFVKHSAEGPSDLCFSGHLGTVIEKIVREKMLRNADEAEKFSRGLTRERETGN